MADSDLPRRSMWAEELAARVAAILAALRCPGCGEQNQIGKKPMLELLDGQAFCNKCSKAWLVNEGDMQ